MSIYANKQTVGTIELMADMMGAPDPSFGLPGDNSPQLMSNGEGGYINATPLDFSLLQAKYPEQFNTPALASGMLIATPGQDSAQNGVASVNVSADTNLSLLNAQGRGFTESFAYMLGMDAEQIQPYASEIFSPEQGAEEQRRRSGFLGAIPTTTGNLPGEEDVAISGVTDSWRTLASDRGRRNFNRANGGTNVQGWDLYDSDRRDKYTLEALHELGRINDAQLKAGQESDEVREGILEAAGEDTLLQKDSARRVSEYEQFFPKAVAEADERELEPGSLVRNQFIYEKASQRTIENLSELVNKQSTPEEGQAVMAQVRAMSKIVGFDFVSEAMLSVPMHDESWRDNAWTDLIPDDMRSVLEEAGFSHDVFIQGARNPYVYRQRATLEAERYVATRTRERLFQRDMHDGWATWTRRFTDTMRTDFAGDPYAMYFTIPTAIAGVGTMFMGTAGTTSIGRVLAYSAVDGMFAGGAEGYAASVAGISDAYRTGNMLELDYSGVRTNIMYYGAAGGIGGGLLGGGIASIGPTARGFSRTSRSAVDMVDSSGVTGAARKQNALNRIAEREAGIPEIEGASLHTNIESSGLAIRLNRGDVEARDVLTEVLPSLVQRQEGEEVSSMVDDLFSAEVLAENGMSQADAVNLVFGIQRSLGAGGQIGSEEFDLIIRAALKASREFAEEGGTDVAGSTTNRIARIDASLKANGIEVKQRFVGGSGVEALTPDEVVKLRDLTNKLKNSEVPGQKMSKAEVTSLAKLALRLNDERQLRGVRNLLANSRRLDDSAMAWFDEKMGKIIETGQAAREDKFLQDALDVETALGLLNNERTIRVAKELGISAPKLMAYINKYKGLVGNADALARLNAEMPDAAKAITKIAEGEGLEILDALPNAFNVQRFLDESQVTDKVRKMAKYRRNLRRKVNKTLGEPTAPEDFDAKVKRTAEGLVEVGESGRRQSVYENLRKELGLSDADDAFENLVQRMVEDMPFQKHGSAMKAHILSKALSKLVLKTSPDAVKIGDEAETRGFMRSMLKGTSLGERIESNFSRLAQYPMSQARLFRHRSRIVRAASNWITGQHITHKVYSNSTDFMSVESIIEGASREAMPYVQTAMSIRTKLGTTNYKLFDTEFMRLRQRGLLEEINLEDISPELRAMYKNTDDLISDLRATQREYTGFMQNAMDELAEAGYPIKTGTSATTYIPNVLKGNLTEAQIERFMGGFRRMKRDQLLNGSTALDYEVIDGLGWIRLLKGSSTDAQGNVVNKEFSIPVDSPFYRSTDEAENIKFAKQVIKEGWSGLLRHAPESKASTSVASAPKLGAAQEIKARNNVDIYKVRQDVNEIAGSDPNLPLGRSAEEAADAEAVARGIAGTDEVIGKLEAQLNELMVSSPAVRQAYFDATGERVEDLMVEIGSMISERRRTLMAHANRELSSGRSKVRRKPMSQNQKIKIVGDRDLFEAQSSGHAALLTRLDNMILEGYLDDSSARVIMLAFVDVDPHKMLGMSFARMDATDSKGVYGRAYDTGDGTGLVTLRRQDEIDGSDPVTVASIMVHEISHIAFLSASPRMQAVMQSLFEQVKSGSNREMAELFQEFGMDSPHTFSNVHEFVAALAEITLVQNQAKAAPKRGMLAQLMAHLGKFWKELIGDVAVLSKEGEGIAEGILGKEQFSAVRSAIKNIYDSAPSETPVDNLKRIFDIEEAAQVDKFGGSAAKLDDAEMAGLMRKAKNTREKADKAAADSKYSEAERAKLAAKADKAEEAVTDAMNKAAAPKPELSEVDEVQRRLIARYLEENPNANEITVSSIPEALGQLDYEGSLFKNGAWPVKDDGTRLTEDELYMSLKSKIISRVSSRNKQRDKSALSEAGQSRSVSMTTSDGSTVDVAAEARVSFERQLEEDRAELAAITQRAAESGNKKIQKQAAELNERMALANALIEMGVLNFQIKRDAKNVESVSLLPVIGKMNEKLGVTKEQVMTGLKARGISIEESKLKKLFNKGGMLNTEDLAARQAKLSESLEGVDATRKAQAEANRKAEEIEAARRESDRVASTPEVQNDVAETSAGKDTRPALKAKAKAKAKAEAPAPKTEAPIIPRLDGETDAEFQARTSSGDLDLKTRYEEDAKARLEAERRTEESMAWFDEFDAKFDAEAEAPAPKTTEAGDGTPPKDPPKTAKGADGEGEEPKPKLEGTAARLDEYFERKMKSKIATEAGDFNAKHRLSGQGSLADLYRKAVEGDLDVLSPAYKTRLKDAGRQVLSPIDNVARDYIDNAGGGFKGSSIINTNDVDVRINQLGDISRLQERTFNQDHFDGPGGEEIARLFAENSSSMEGVIRYAEGALGSIRLQKALDALTGSRGATMGDFMTQIKTALTENAIVDSRGKKSIGSLSKKETDQIDKYMNQLKDLYLRSRGINPIKDDFFAQGSRITQNFAYSLLGPKFSMSVGFVEAPGAILRTSGLNPLKMIKNTGLMFAALINAAQGTLAKSHPQMAKWMAATGLDTKIMKQTLGDLTYELSSLRTTSMAKFGGANSMEDGDLMITLVDRLRNHKRNILSAWKGQGSDDSIISRAVDVIEAGTAASADLGGIASGMLPMTNAVRVVASNQAKSLLFKYVDNLTALASRMDGESLTLNEVIGLARELGIPRQTAVYAAEAGLLRAGVMEELVAATGITARSDARAFSLNDLSRTMSESRARSRNVPNDNEFVRALGETQSTRDQVVPAVNNFIMYFTGELSPELRGTMRFTGTNPLVDMMFQMLSYPLAAYQALVKNGVHARGPLMTTGLLMSLVALEANNRHLQNVLDVDKDEDARKKSMEWFTTPMTTQKIVETLATQGTASPLFGIHSSYLRDLVGNPMLKAVGSDAKNFPARPFASPAISTLQRGYGAASRALGHATGDDPGSKRAGTSYEKLRDLAWEATPLNALPVEMGMNAYKAATNSYKSAALAVTEGSKRIMPGATLPNMVDFSHFKWMSADEQPSGFDQVQLPKEEAQDRFSNSPAPVEAQKLVPKSGPTSPSSGLVDRLK